METTEILRLYAMQFVGVPYLWGGETPMGGYDCSGFVQELLRSVDMDPPADQSAQALYDHFKLVSRPNIFSCGALAFYGKNEASIEHVAMLLDRFRIIEAGGGGPQVVSLDAAIKRMAFIRMRPLNHRLDLVAVLMPGYQP